MGTSKGKFQFFNFFPEWQGSGFTKLDYKVTSLALIYRWSLCLGWIEIRRWVEKGDYRWTGTDWQPAGEENDAQS